MVDHYSRRKYMNNSNNYRTKIMPTWCPGCPNFLLFSQILKSVTANNIATHDLTFCYDIGCSGNIADFLHCYGLHGLHGRSIPVAMAVKLVNPNLLSVLLVVMVVPTVKVVNHLIAVCSS